MVCPASDKLNSGYPAPRQVLPVHENALRTAVLLPYPAASQHFPHLPAQASH